MVIELWLEGKELKRYRSWKQDVRVSGKLVRKFARLLYEDRSLRRLTDSDFYPIFICGVSGSGTTLIGGLLDQNFDNELCIHVSDRNANTSRYMWMRKSFTYDSLEEYIEDLFNPNQFSTRRIRSAVLGLYRRLVDYPRRLKIVLDKAPNSHLVRIGKLREAFPHSGVILLYRDPVEVIEGMKRKWAIPFGLASVKELSDFWILVHERFLQEMPAFKDDLFVLSYERLVKDPEYMLNKIVQKYNLEPRLQKNVDYRERGNIPGKGLRNVVSGEIKVVQNAFDQVEKSISEKDMELIRQLTMPTFNKLESINAELNQ